MKNAFDKGDLHETGAGQAPGATGEISPGAVFHYLCSLQNSDGGWGTARGEASSLYMTAMVMISLRRFPGGEDRSSSLDRATGYILSRQHDDGGFGDAFSTVHETALACRALEGLVDDPAVAGRARHYLALLQLENGSWNDDLYSTALALGVWVNPVDGTWDPSVDDPGPAAEEVPDTTTQPVGPGGGHVGTGGTPSRTPDRLGAEEDSDRGGATVGGHVREPNTKISLVSRRKASATAGQEPLPEAASGGRSVVVRSVDTDRKRYGACEAVYIHSSIENRSDVEFSVIVNAQLADVHGHIVDVANHETGPAVKLGAGASERVTLLWNTGTSQPGAYSVRFHVADAASGSIVDERKITFAVAPSVVIDDPCLFVTPAGIDQDETRTVQLVLKLQNKSNTDALLRAVFRVTDPEGAAIHEGQVDFELPSTVPERTLDLPPLSHSFNLCGQYLVEVSVRSGEMVCSQALSTIRVSSSPRIRVVRDLDPASVIPGGDRKVRVAIRLEGAGAAVNPSFLSAATNTAGDRITIAFDRAMAEPTGGDLPFTVTADGVSCGVAEVRLAGSDITRVDLLLAAAVTADQAISVSYSGPGLTCGEGKPLMSFHDETVANNVSPPIFNQDGYGFSGRVPPNPLASRTVMTGYGEWPAGFYKNALAFAGAAFDGQAIWMVPANADSVVRVDTATGEMTAFNRWPEGFRKSNLAFAGAVFDGQAIWMVPANADSVVRIDTATGEMTAFNRWPEGFSKGGHAFAGGVLADGCLWMVPSYADSVVKLDTVSGEMMRYNGWPTGFARRGYAFAGGVYDGRCIWMVPANAESVVKLDTASGEMTAYSEWPAGLGKVEYAFAGGVYDGRHIWLVPYYADRVVRIDGETGRMTGHHPRPAGLGKVEYAFAGAVFDGQGIWMVPLNADRVVRMDKDTVEATEYPGWPQGFTKGVNAFAGGVFDGECIWMIPSYADRVVRIASFSSLSVSASITASDAFWVYVSQDESEEGRLVGQGRGWSTVHSLNAALVPGVTNYVHVKCVETAGPVGAFIADLALNDESFRFADGSRRLLTSEGAWRVYTDGFGGKEVTVTAVCRNGEGSWSTRFGIDLDASWIWTHRGADRGTRFFSAAIYHSPLPVAPMEDVRVTDTIAGPTVTIDESSFTRRPSLVEQRGEDTAVEWCFPEFRAGQREDLYFDDTLSDAKPGQERLISHSLEMTYKDAEGMTARTELGPCHARVLRSPFVSSISTRREVYRMGEEVAIFGTIKSLGDLGKTLNVRIVMEDGQGVLIEETFLEDLCCEPGEDRTIEGVVFKLVATNAGPHEVRLVLNEEGEEILLASAWFTVEDASAEPAFLPVGGADSGEVQADAAGAGDVSEEGRGGVRPVDGVDEPSAASLFSGGTDALQGTISAQPSPIYQGLSETIYYTASKSDGGNMAGLGVCVVIVHRETGEERRSFPAPQAHLRGGSFTGSFTFSTGPLEPGEYDAILQFSVPPGGERREIAATSFVVRRIETVVT